MHPASRYALTGTLLALTAGCAAIRRAQDRRAATQQTDVITLADAREILGRAPVAIPGYPVTLRRLYGRSVLVEQVVDSGKLVMFHETIGDCRRGASNRTDLRGDDIRMTRQALEAGTPTPAEMSLRTRQCRRFGSVAVVYLGGLRTGIPHDLLDRLQPL